jgi:hypothetical protein
VIPPTVYKPAIKTMGTELEELRSFREEVKLFVERSNG